MDMRFFVMDVETPNRANDRISSIGYAIIENGEITKSGHYLCNPEVPFDSLNEKLTGITAEDVMGSPAFPAIWEQVAPMVEESVWIGHGFHFDLNVLCKCLTAYELPIPEINYCDTITLAKQVFPGQESYKLDALCTKFGIPLEHHKSESDAMAAASILLRLMEEGADIEKCLHHFEWPPMDSSFSYGGRTHKLSDSTMRINYLLNMLEDISDDGIISPSEIKELLTWMAYNQDLSGNVEFDKMWNALSSILKDGKITHEEHQALLTLAKQLQDPVKAAQTVTDLSLDGKNVCLSGDFDHGSKAEITALLQDRGAIVLDSVTKKVDYLIVGGQGSSAWAAGNYGTKVKKALAMQEKGINIQIIREADLFDFIGTLV